MPQPVKMTIRNVRACPRAGWNMPDSGIADFSDEMPAHGPPDNRPARGCPKAHGHLPTPTDASQYGRTFLRTRRKVCFLRGTYCVRFFTYPGTFFRTRRKVCFLRGITGLSNKGSSVIIGESRQVVGGGWIWEQIH